MIHFANRVVLITGAANGMGRGFCKALALRGARLGAIDRLAGPLDELGRELAGRPFASAVADVRDAPGLSASVRRLEEQLGPADVLIANAGIIRKTSALDFRPEDFAEEVQVNLIGVANSVAAVLPGMLERRRGHLVAMSSIASYRGLPPLAGYCASKAGVRALFDALRVELRSKGIRTTTICPGFIKTQIAAHLDFPEPPTLSVDDAVGRMLGAISSGREFFAFPTRDVWPVWLMRHLPRRLSDWLARRYLVRLRGNRTSPGAAKGLREQAESSPRQEISR
jgi:NAD(P)-dependent dehydrogenase (short-subunit alcohol dehydrogenase family)